MLLKNKLNNNAGVSLVEVIVSVALITIISVTFLDILTGSFSNTMDAGRENKEFYEAAGEMDIAIRDVSYYGQNNNIDFASETVTIFGQNINTRVIHSKTEDLDTSIDVTTDPYIYAYVVDEDLSRTDEAYIDVDNNGTFDLGTDLIVTAEQLNGPYIYLGNGPLRITDQGSIYNPMDTIDWYVKDGIIVSSGIEIYSNSEVSIKSVNGNFLFNNIIINGVNAIVLENSDNIELIQSVVQSTSDNISVTADNVDITGIDSDHMKFDVAVSQTIDFYVNNTITLNEYTEFIIDGVAGYAHNKSDATLDGETEDVVDSDEFR
jgi:hypothetical protein